MKRFAALLLATLVAGCTSASGTGSVTATAAGRTDRLVIGQGREFNSLLPFMNNGFTAGELIGLSYSLLVTLGPNGYIPDVALAVPSVANGGISRDGRTITYHLRHDVRWQDGKPLTARDVLFTQSVVMNPHALLSYRDGFDRVASIAAPDPYTVVVHLRSPYRLFVVNFLGPQAPTGILPEHLLAKTSDIPHSDYASRPVGSGPYTVGTWHHGESITFDANPDWYGGRPAIKQIVLHFIPDPTTRLTQLRTHEIDAEMTVSAETASQVRDLPGVRVDAERVPAFMHLTFNLKDPVVGQPAVRLAVAHAIDAQAIAARVSHGLFDGRDGARGLYLLAYDAKAGYPAYDRTAARRLLAAAGYHLGSDGYRHGKGGERLAFTVALRADRSDDNAAAVQVQQQLRDVGIDVGLKSYSATQFTANDSITRTGIFTAELSSFFANIEPDASVFLGCGARGMNGFNESGYCDPVTDADITRSLAEPDRASVRAALARVQRRTNAAMPIVFLWQAVDVNIVPARLQRFSDLLGSPYANVGSWSL